MKININNKQVEIKLTKAANRAIQQRTSPLFAEMELYFSCLVRKKVRFYETNNDVEHIKSTASGLI